MMISISSYSVKLHFLSNFYPTSFSRENFMAIGKVKIPFKAIEKFRYGLRKNNIETP